MRSKKVGRSLALLALGGITGWGHAPLDWWWMPFLTFPLFLHLLKPLRGWAAYRASWVFAFGYFLFGLYWISNALLLDVASFWWALPLAAAGLPLVLALFQAVAGWGAQQWGRESNLSRLLLFAVLWSAMEWVRGHIFTGFPWLMLGQLWVDVDWARPLAALGGAYFLSFWAVLLAVLPAAPRTSYLPALLLGGTLLTGAAGYAVAYTAPAPPPSRTLRVELIQPNIAQDLKLDHAARDRMLAETLAAASPPDPRAQVVIWPETAVPYRLEDDPELRQMLARTLAPGALLLTGVVRKDADDNYYNSLVALDSHGTLQGHYDKAHLVPFGEYIPFRQFLPFDPIAGGKEFSAGPGPRTLRVGALPPFSPLICYEAIFPGAVTDRNDPPDWLLTITNDGWYGLSHGPYQHLAQARLRAVEEGIPLVRVANTGISAVISERGDVLSNIPLGKAGRQGATLALTSIKTPYTVWRDALFLGVLLATLFLFRCVRNRVPATYRTRKSWML